MLGNVICNACLPLTQATAGSSEEVFGPVVPPESMIIDINLLSRFCQVHMLHS